jgi:hypothetical protein
MVNMPNCTDLLFTIKDNVIIKSKRVNSIDSQKALLYYNLSDEMQNAIDTFLNPQAL